MTQNPDIRQEAKTVTHTGLQSLCFESQCRVHSLLQDKYIILVIFKFYEHFKYFQKHNRTLTTHQKSLSQNRTGGLLFLKHKMQIQGMFISPCLISVLATSSHYSSWGFCTAILCQSVVFCWSTFLPALLICLYSVTTNQQIQPAAVL